MATRRQEEALIRDFLAMRLDRFADLIDNLRTVSDASHWEIGISAKCGHPRTEFDRQSVLRNRSKAVGGNGARVCDRTERVFPRAAQPLLEPECCRPDVDSDLLGVANDGSGCIRE